MIEEKNNGSPLPLWWSKHQVNIPPFSKAYVNEGRVTILNENGTEKEILREGDKAMMPKKVKKKSKEVKHGDN